MSATSCLEFLDISRTIDCNEECLQANAWCMTTTHAVNTSLMLSKCRMREARLQHGQTKGEQPLVLLKASYQLSQPLAAGTAHVLQQGFGLCILSISSRLRTTTALMQVHV